MNALKRSLSEAIAAASGLSAETVFGLLEKPKNPDFGDLAFPCFQLAKMLRLPPPKCAEKLKEDLTLPEGFTEATVTGPFLNFRVNRPAYVAKTVKHLLLESERFGRGGHGAETYIIEYSSPNIAKPFHVGHLRTTFIGNALDRVYRHLGYNVISINHLGDWGTQFGFVWAGCTLWGKPENPGIKELVGIYRRATALKDAQENNTVAPEDASLPSVNDIARQYFLDLEAGAPYAVDFWKWCLEISMDYMRRTYERFGVAFDHYTGESFYSDKLDGVKTDLEKAGVLQESKGALGVDLGDETGFARIFTPDGRSLYLTRDLATAKYRWETFHFDRCIYVVGAPQTLHFKQITGVLKKIGAPYAERLLHVAYGHVAGMKTRGSGEVVEVNEFFDEAHERALVSYHEEVSKRPEGLNEDEVAEAVALSAIFFSTLKVSRLKEVEFNWDRALAFQGDSGPYLLYAYARINGIKQKAVEAGLAVGAAPKLELLKEESAFELTRLLESFPATLEKVTAENEPAILCSYALDVAYALSKAYLDLKVLGEEKDLAEARLALFEATRTVLGLSIKLLGMRLIERM